MAVRIGSTAVSGRDAAHHWGCAAPIQGLSRPLCRSLGRPRQPQPPMPIGITTARAGASRSELTVLQSPKPFAGSEISSTPGTARSVCSARSLLPLFGSRAPSHSASKLDALPVRSVDAPRVATHSISKTANPPSTLLCQRASCADVRGRNNDRAPQIISTQFTGTNGNESATGKRTRSLHSPMPRKVRFDRSSK